MPIPISAIIKIAGITSDKDLSGELNKLLNPGAIRGRIGGGAEGALSGLLTKIEKLNKAGANLGGLKQSIGNINNVLNALGDSGKEARPILDILEQANSLFVKLSKSSGKSVNEIEKELTSLTNSLADVLRKTEGLDKAEAKGLARRTINQAGVSFAVRAVDSEIKKNEELGAFKREIESRNRANAKKGIQELNEEYQLVKRNNAYRDKASNFLNKVKLNTVEKERKNSIVDSGLQRQNDNFVVRREQAGEKAVEAAERRAAGRAQRIARQQALNQERERRAAAAATARSRRFVEASPGKTQYYRYQQEQKDIRELESLRKAAEASQAKAVREQGQAAKQEAAAAAKYISDREKAEVQAAKDVARLQKDADTSRAKQVREQGAEARREATAANRYIRDRNRYNAETEATLRRQRTILADLLRLYQQTSTLADQAGTRQAQVGRRQLALAIDRRRNFIRDYTVSRSRGSRGGGPGGPGGPPPPPPPEPPDDFTRGAVAAARASNNLNRTIVANRFSVENLGRAAVLAFRRYSAFLIGTSLIYNVIGSLRRASNDFLEFEAQITKLEQVSTVTAKEIGAITTQILNLATQTGVAGTEIAKATQTLAQAGFGKSAEDLKRFNLAITKVPLAATFGDIAETTDGLIAIFGQFNKGLNDTANILDIVNQYAADFAIESKDIFEIVKRGGSAFATAGGSFEELVKLSSVLRSSTRESAETIGTFFKTSIAQLLSPKSQKELKLLGVTADGVVDQLTQLSGIISTGNFDDIQKIQIAENLTGERQFARLLALLKQIGDPRIQDQLRETGNAVTGSLDRSIQKRLDDVGVSLQRIRQSTNELFTSFINNDAVKKFVSGLADIVSQTNKLVAALKPLAPLLLAVGGAFALRAGAGIGRQVLGRVGLGGAGGVGGAARNLLGRPVQNFQSTPVPNGLPITGFVNGSQRAANRRAQLARRGFGLAGLSFGLPLAGSFIGDELSQSTNSRTAKLGSNIQTTAGFAAAGAGIGSFGGPVVTGIGAGVGAIVGIIKGISDDIDEQNKILLAEKVRLAKTPLEKLNALISTSKGKNAPADVFSDSDPVLKQVKLSEKFAGLKSISKDDEQQTFESLLNQKLSELRQNALDSLDIQSLDLSNDSIVNRKVANLNREILVKLTQDISEATGVNPADVFNDISNAYGEQLIKGLQSSDIFGLFSKKITKFFEGLDFGAQIKSVNSIFSKVANSLLGVFEGLNSQADSLANIVTNVNEQFTIKLPTNNKDLFKAKGLDPLAAFDAGIKDFSDKLLKSLGNDNIFELVKRINSLTKDVKETPADESKLLQQQLDKVLSVADSSTIGKEFQAQLQYLSQQSGEDVLDILKDLANLGGKSIQEFVKNLVGSNGINDALDKVAEAARKDAELFNQRLTIENSLKASLRELGQASFDANQNINDFTNVLRDRLTEQLDFINEVGAVQSQTNAGRTAVGDANQRQFGGTPQFIQQLLAAANDRNKQNTTAQDSGASKTAAQGANDALNVFLDLQQNLGQRLAELDNKVGDASRASDALRGAFTTLRDQIKGAGQAVTQFTVKGLADGISALREFRKNGLESLGDTQFSDLQKLLSSVGDFDLGGGVSGSKILGDINQQLGSTFLAAIRSEFTGETLDESQAAIAAQVEGLRKEQAAAAELEKTLRTEQLTLLKAQAQLIPIEQQFYQEQLARLNEINLSLDPLKEIAATVQSLKPPIAVKLEQTAKTVAPPPITGTGAGDVKEAERRRSGLKGPRSKPLPDENKSRQPARPIEAPLGILPGSTKPVRTPSPDKFVPNPRLTKPTSQSPTTTPVDPFTPPLRFGPAPAFTDPNGRPTLTRPTDPRFQRPEPEPLFRREFENPFKKNGDDTIFVKSVDSLNVGFEKAVKSLEKYNGTLEKLISGEARESVVRTQLDISPIQVNVAISAPDVLKLAGNSVYNAIIQAVAPAIASALGVVGPEVRNNFEANLPKALV